MLQIYRNQFSPLDIPTGKAIPCIDIFSASSGTRELRVGKKSTLQYICIVQGNCDLHLDVFTDGPHSNITIHGLFLADKESIINTHIHVHLKHDASTAKVHLVSFLTQGGKCHIDGGVTVYEQTSQCVGDLLEETILLGDRVEIKMLPRLDVHSNDVKASHGATIQRLDAEKLFYLTSKGIPPQEAKRLMIESYFTNLFSLFGEEQGVQEIKNTYLTHLLATL